jgi:hypothetical protein
MSLRTGWVYKRKRNPYHSLFSKWNKRYITCDDRMVQLYKEDGIPPAIIPIKEILEIKATDIDGEFTISTKERMYLFVTLDNDNVERDMWVLFIDAIKTKYEKEIRRKSIEINEELNNYVASLRSESIFRHFRTDYSEVNVLENLENLENIENSQIDQTEDNV